MLYILPKQGLATWIAHGRVKPFSLCQHYTLFPGLEPGSPAPARRNHASVGMHIVLLACWQALNCFALYVRPAQSMSATCWRPMRCRPC